MQACQGVQGVKRCRDARVCVCMGAGDTWSLPLSRTRDSARSGNFGTTELNIEPPIAVVESSDGSRWSALKQHKRTDSRLATKPTPTPTLPDPSPNSTLLPSQPALALT